LFFLGEDTERVVSVLERLGVCQIERVPTELKDYLAPYFPAQFRDAFRRLRDLYEPLAQRWQLASQGFADVPHVPTADEMNRLARSMETVSAQVAELARRARQLAQRETELEHFDEYVKALAELDIDVAALADLRFLHLRVGTVPLENFNRLKESAALTEDVVLPLGTRRDRAHVMVVGAGGITPDLEGLLVKADFEPIDTSDSIFAADADNIQQRLAQEAAAVPKQFHELEREEKQVQDGSRALLLHAAQVVAGATVLAECEGAIEGRAPLAFLTGWVARDRLTELKEALARDVRNPVAVTHEPPGDGDDGQPPSDCTVPAIFRPGVSLVSLYGPPGYDEINPTLVLALSTPLLFGMMFGDVGYGVLLAAAAILLRRWLGHWIAVVLSCSLASVVFGFLYGSVFGVEHWLPAIWLRPMDEPFRLLAFSLWAGVGFIVLAFLLKAASLLRQGRRQEALLGFQGGGGAVLYFGAVFVCRSLYVDQAVSVPAMLLFVGGLALTAIHAANELNTQGRSAVAELATEYFHGILSLLTNTLSFLRLAAFALSHAALSMALFFLVEMIPPTTLGWALRVVVLVVGSTVALVLHVLVVAVQTIRLQFYEGLTRYFRGDGRVFQPLQFPETTQM
jgi:V/A-type H+-transporting ATPase subunit I